VKRSRAARGLACALLAALASTLRASAEEEAAAEPAEAGRFAAAWAVPAEEACRPEGGLRGAPGGDASALSFAFEPGAAVEHGKLESIRRFLPKEVWENRERFFYDGMRLEIGPCFRDYAPPAFFAAATEKFRGQAVLTEAGGLEGHTAGLPFAPDAIDPKDESAGQRWAWNVQERYQGAGFRGRFRIVDLLGRTGRAEPFEGEIFKMHLGHRADRAEADYRMPFAKGKHWVAGGVFRTPFDAKDYAWRQYRDDDNRREAKRSDDLHAYLPQWRRVRRISAVDVEGLYMPSYSVGVVPAQQLAIPGGGGVDGGGTGGGGGLAGVASEAGGTIQTKRSGFEGLELRPILWSFRLLGQQDLLAPINVASPMWPEDAERDFGPWGLSFASDRWELRRALVLEGRVRGSPRERGEARQLFYVDLQTLVPLYYVSYDAKDEAIDVGVFAGRWSEDRSDYPKWPDDRLRPVRVIDSVGAAFANLGADGSWRRESWDIVSVPPPDDELERMESVAGLTKGH
jgi:hypothetical protein